MLYIISTPIGNIEDITFRAVRILKEVDLIVAEDTRRSGTLLKKYQIKNKTTSYHEHTSEKKEDSIIELLKEGKDIALISDSGTPLISDPGYKLVRKAIKNNIIISPIPGATASIASLTASGCTTNEFMFLGFFPKKKSEQKKIMEKIKSNNITTIIYESPHRVEKTIGIMKEHIPERKICISRETTKKFEEFIRGTVSDVFEKIKQKKLKGEISIVIDKEF